MSRERERYLQRLGDELERATRADLESRRRRRSRPRERKPLRAALLAIGIAVLASGSAWATASVLGVINLGGGEHAEQVESAPEWNAISGTFTSRPAGSGYVYHIVGSTMLDLSCGPADALQSASIYVRSTRRLGRTELKALLAGELIAHPVSNQALEHEARARLRARQRGTRQPTTWPTPLPAGVISISNQCPGPGEAPEEPPLSTLAGVGAPAPKATRPAP